MAGHGGSSAGSYLADPTSPIPSHCASIVATNTLRVNNEICNQDTEHKKLYKTFLSLQCKVLFLCSILHTEVPSRCLWLFSLLCLHIPMHKCIQIMPCRMHNTVSSLSFSLFCTQKEVQLLIVTAIVVVFPMIHEFQIRYDVITMCTAILLTHWRSSIELTLKVLNLWKFT